GRRLAGDAVDAVRQENRVIVHRRQAASHKNVFIQQITCVSQEARSVSTLRAAQWSVYKLLV
ncbi:hypothetical protein, partial [Pseudomonas viridiflava]|uniref:hypothetical protein n=1 Tax=Pseudomonas viridiflava TaxID=33069 RepID=UPI0019D6F97B